MAYNSMKKLITNEINKLKTGMITPEDFEVFKKSAMDKLDVFASCDRITPAQYKELVDMLNVVNE